MTNEEQEKFIQELQREEKVQSLTPPTAPANYALYPHYFREVPNATHVDVNWVLEAWNVGHTVGHAVKKLLCCGQRGFKDKLRDLKEARDSINRAIELEETKSKGKE